MTTFQSKAVAAGLAVGLIGLSGAPPASAQKLTMKRAKAELRALAKDVAADVGADNFTIYDCMRRSKRAVSCGIQFDFVEKELLCQAPFLVRAPRGKSRALKVRQLQKSHCQPMDLDVP
jgi:hypothetical protein